MQKPPFEQVWTRICGHAGDEFRQIRGGVFRFEADSTGITPDRTNQRFTRKQIAEAYRRMPVKNTVALQDLRGPSYLYAILMDDRIRRGDW